VGQLADDVFEVIGMNDAQTVYLNGEFLPLEEARIPVLDRGFIFGDGIYEVVPVYGGRPFRLAHHLRRLARSLSSIGIENPFDDAGWTALVSDLVGRHAWPDQFVYMQVTRGVARRDHPFPKGVRPTVFAMSSAFVAPAAELRERGLSVITRADDRWLHCDIKSVSLLGNVLARQEAVEAGAAECVMFRDGMLTEGSSSNIWVVRQGRVLGPPTDHLVREGIRVGLIGELCAASGIPHEQRRITREEVFAADELMLSSATREILPITRIDAQPVGNGQVGPVYRRLYQAYQAAKAA
jgi:D-alanine transaminase